MVIVKWRLHLMVKTPWCKGNRSSGITILFWSGRKIVIVMRDGERHTDIEIMCDLANDYESCFANTINRVKICCPGKKADGIITSFQI